MQQNNPPDHAKTQIMEFLAQLGNRCAELGYTEEAAVIFCLLGCMAGGNLDLLAEAAGIVSTISLAALDKEEKEQDDAGDNDIGGLT